VQDQPIGQNIPLSAQEIKALDARISRALARIPAASIPENFAAMVASHLPARSFAEVKATQYGRNAAVLCFLLLLAALPLLAPATAKGSAMMICLQWMLCFQFALIGAWIASKSVRSLFFM
jgi:hypothetical protein